MSGKATDLLDVFKLVVLVLHGAGSSSCDGLGFSIFNEFHGAEYILRS
jgi:hypothetical protein